MLIFLGFGKKVKFFQKSIDKKNLYGSIKHVGVDYAGVSPVPFSNTEVKPSSAEDTCLVTDWENRKMPTLFFLLVLKFPLLRRFFCAIYKKNKKTT